MDICKICGAPRDPLNTNCKFCDTTYHLVSLTGETYINALRTILARIDESEQQKASAGETVGSAIASVFTNKLFAGADAKVSAISTFTMPSDVESLLLFLAFCHGNAQVAVAFNDDVGDRIKGAWNGKARMAYSQLKMKAIANSTLAPYIAEYEALYGVRAKKPMAGRTKMIIGVGVVFVVLMVFVGIMSIRESKQVLTEKTRVEAVIQKVQSLVAAGQYDAAEASCADIQWTWELQYDSSKEMAKAYDKKREDLRTLVAEARRKVGN